MTTLEKPFRVEWEDNGCTYCYGHRTFYVVGPDDVPIGQPHGIEESADEMAELLNMAYDKGMKAALKEGYGEQDHSLHTK